MAASELPEDQFTQDFRTQRRNYSDGDTRLGDHDRLWYDGRTRTIRIYDGTAGGTILAGADYIGDNIDLDEFLTSEDLAAYATTAYVDSLVGDSTQHVTDAELVAALTPYATIQYVNDLLEDSSAPVTVADLDAAVLGLASEAYVDSLLATDLTPYSTTVEMNTAISTATTDMATQTWVGAQGYLTAHQDITGKADVGVSYTKAEADANFLTAHQSLDDYSTTVEMNSAISTAVNDLVGGADSTLDTLNELAAALGDDANFATTVTNSLAGKSDLDHTHDFLKGDVFADDSSLLVDAENSKIVGDIETNSLKTSEQSIHLGLNSGATTPGNYSLAIGLDSGQTNQGEGAIAIGKSAGDSEQGDYAIAIGYEAGQITQGNNAIAIGKGAGEGTGNNQAANSIVINASGVVVNNTTADSLVIKPIRAAAGSSFLYYNDSTGEVTYSSTGTLYNDSDVDTHINQSSATANQVLSWTGADYAWVAQSVGSASVLADLTDVDSVDTVATGDFLLHDGSEYKFVNFQQEVQSYVNAGTSNIAIQNLTDVDSVDTIANGDVLLYDDSSNHFGFANLENEINTRLSTRSISNLTDVDTAGVSPGDFLTYNNTAGEWQPKTVTTSDIPEGTNKYYTDFSVDAHINQSSATANQLLSWTGADYAWIDSPYGDSDVASYLSSNPQPGNPYGNQIVYNLANPTNSVVLDAGPSDGLTQAWFYGDVVSDPDNPTTSVVLDISAGTFTGNVIGEVHGDVKTADGFTTILDVDSGNGTALLTGKVSDVGNHTINDLDVKLYTEPVSSPGAYDEPVDKSMLIYDVDGTDGNFFKYNTSKNIVIQALEIDNNSDGKFLKWQNTGSTFLWVDVVSEVTSSDLNMGTNKILFSNVYSNLVDLPNASSYHGMFAHVHATGKAYFAHNGAWVELANAGTGGSYSDLDVATYLNGNLDTHIIPDTNAAYDLGNAEYKIRHLFLSDNSIYMGDNEVPIGLTADKLTVNGDHVKDTSTVAPDNGAVIDITKSNHFVTAGETYVLSDGAFIGQELKFWRTNGTGHVDIDVTSISYVDASNVATSGNNVLWRLGDAHVGMYSCIWTGTYWHWSNGQLAV